MNTLLVANRGEIARRVFRTARAMGLRCIAVYVDADAGAPFIAEADEAVRIPAYLDGAAVIAAAQATGADAIHPGYGFLSENAAFAADVIAAGITWVGPTPEVIEAMGDKIAAKRAAVAAGVPTLPSSDEPTADAAEQIGFPLLVKAAAGGGGKGMRIVSAPAEFDEAVAAAKREALGGFGDDRVFLERYVPRSRHIEIQILGDTHGNVVHVGERECSIQRRHQKIVEESPSTALDDETREAMGDAAVDLARALGYQSAGTVEFLFDDETREFYFLEVNTRLQVEHPVTEEVALIDLVQEQLQVAQGKPLSRDSSHYHPVGCAIEVRLYAEDAAAGFLPATGTLAAFVTPDEPEVRWDTGVEQGSVVGTSFDPMLAKVIASGFDREETARCLALALERLHIGGVTTNRDFLVSVLRSPEFLAGATTTDFIERVQPAPTAPVDLARVGAVAVLWLQGWNRANALVLETMPSGWRNARLPAQQVKLRHGDEEVVVEYARRRDGSFSLGEGRTARVHHWSERGIDAEVDGRRSAALVTKAGDVLYVQTPQTTVELHVVPRFTVPGDAGAVGGGFVAPMPGVVLDVRVNAGDHVTKGQTLVVLEAMKMEHHMNAPEDGVVAEVRVHQGQQVENGALLLVFEEHGEQGDG